MVYNGKPYKSMDDLGENPIFSETPTYTHIELYTLPDIGLVREFVRVWHPAITFASKKSNPWRHIYSLDSFTFSQVFWNPAWKNHKTYL